MARTQAEIQDDLDVVTAALQKLIAGDRLTRLQLGSGEFSRVYEFQELTYDNLKTEEANLKAELDAITSEQQMQFRNNSSIPLIVTKFPRY